ncbi:MAG TPA: hypothetical protein VE198_09440 [Actinoallomurus sp.]|nr:hypothetical protein [Actinoallomurus sp.]
MVLDEVMPRASRMADHLLVWWLIAAVMAAAGDRRSRRAAVRAVLAMAVAGSISNAARTQLFDRERPPAPVRESPPVEQSADHPGIAPAGSMRRSPCSSRVWPGPDRNGQAATGTRMPGPLMNPLGVEEW